MDVVMNILHIGVTVYTWLIIFSVLGTWVPAINEGAIGRFIHKLVDPYLDLFRFIPPIGMIDISPVVAILVFNYFSSFLLIGIESVVGYIA